MSRIDQTINQEVQAANDDTAWVNIYIHVIWTLQNSKLNLLILVDFEREIILETKFSFNLGVCMYVGLKLGVAGCG